MPSPYSREELIAETATLGYLLSVSDQEFHSWALGAAKRIIKTLYCMKGHEKKKAFCGIHATSGHWFIVLFIVCCNAA
jgi:hypothetical protein